MWHDYRSFFSTHDVLRPVNALDRRSKRTAVEMLNKVKGFNPNELFYGSIMDLIHTRKWNDWLDFSIDLAYGNNSNNTGDVVARVSPDGKTATVAFLCTNSGVIVWEINTE